MLRAAQYEDPWIQHWLAEIKLAQGDPVAAQSLLAQVPLDFSPIEWIWRTRFTAALYLRDYDAANRVIAATPAKFADVHDSGNLRRVGLTDRLRVRVAISRKRWRCLQPRAKAGRDVGDKPKDETYFELAARLDAGLGRKEEAIREALRAVDLMPIAKDSLLGS